MQIHKLHGLLLDANKRLDPHDNHCGPLPYHILQQLDAKVLEEHQVQPSGHSHGRAHSGAHQFSGGAPKRQSQPEIQRVVGDKHKEKGHLLLQRLHNVLAAILFAARMHIPTHSDDSF